MSDLIPDLEIEAACEVADTDDNLNYLITLLEILLKKKINLLTDDDIASLDKRIDGCVKNLFDIANGDY